jgi:hypothetical protein
VHCRSGGYNEIAGDMRGEDATEGKKAGEVNHSSNDAIAAAGVVPFLPARFCLGDLPD